MSERTGQSVAEPRAARPPRPAGYHARLSLLGRVGTFLGVTVPLAGLAAAAEAKLITLACSPPPDERARWTMRMLADKLVELEVVPAVSTETVRRVRSKTWSSRTSTSSGACRAGRRASSSPGWRT